MVSPGTFDWPVVDEFIDRDAELARLDAWWGADERMPVNLYGRRRAGKSWLFRRFAHGKPAVILVARRIAPGAQLAAFSEQLAPVLGVEPSIPDVAGLIRILFRMARSEKILAVIDEFPSLLSSTDAAIERELSAIQAVLEEERDASKLKLILCGSTVSQMEALMSERGPLHGRLVPLRLEPMRFAEGALFMRTMAPVARFERFAVAGGMPRYLAMLADGRRSTRDVLCEHVLDRNAPLWNEPRVVLEQELREPKVYFSILQALAGGDKELNEIVQRLRSTPAVVSKYLSVLQELRLVTRRVPVDAHPTTRNGHWHLRDPFFRFWFRFVFPFQDELESGLDPVALYDGEVAPVLSEHVSLEFEDWCREWVRRTHGTGATKVGAWWGPARHDLRRTGVRHSEEIDIVGVARGRVTVVGEAKWQNRQMDTAVLDDLHDRKMPALAQAGWKLAATPRIVLLSRGGYSAKLVARASTDDRIELVDVADALDS